jgi:hypothetical protein
MIEIQTQLLKGLHVLQKNGVVFENFFSKIHEPCHGTCEVATLLLHTHSKQLFYY